MKLSISFKTSLPPRSDVSDWIRLSVQDIIAFIIANLTFTLAIILFKPFDFSEAFTNNLQFFAFVFLFLCALYFSKYSLYVLLNHILEMKGSGFLFVQQMNWLHYGFSFVLSLLSLIWYYQFNPIVKSGVLGAVLISVFVAWAFRVIKLFQFSMANRTVSPFYLIFYLCALEISPLLFLFTIWQ